jgi:MoxR-like ATPase
MSDQAVERVRAAITRAARGLVDREVLVELIVLAAVAGEHLLVIGPPGTAKSVAARRVARELGGRRFEYLLGRFTEPSELFGPVDLRLLREGRVQTDVSGMLPEAEVAFLDEIFLGSTAILNTLLGVLQERRFRRGHTDLACPLRVCVAASNALPDEVALAAFADRFLIRVFVEPVPDPMLEALLEGGWAAETKGEEEPPAAGMADLDELQTRARAMDLSAVRPEIAQALRTLRRAGVQLSDRRAVQCQRLIAAAAALAGRDAPTDADLWPLLFAVPTPEEQSIAQDVLQDLLSRTTSSALPAAADAASRGPLARAERLVRVAEEVLAERPPEPGSAWHLRLEGVLREIDASFETAHLPSALADARAALVAALPS